MAHTEFPPRQASFNATYLNEDEQHLLMNALNSNQPGKGSPAGKSTTDTREASDFYSPDFGPAPGSGQFEETPYLEYDGLDEGPYDWEVDGQMIGDLPGGADGADDEIGDKRKNSADEDGSNKRTSEDKTNKKPGRKPLTSEPTTVSRYDANAIRRLTNLETESTESRSAASFPGAEGATLKRARIQSRRSGKGIRGDQS
jgi:hypothetical protein